MPKEPEQKKCEWCNKWFGTIRGARFCSDRHRVAWHRQQELDGNLKVFTTLREALRYCIKQHPELSQHVNEILATVQVDLVENSEKEETASSSDP